MKAIIYFGVIVALALGLAPLFLPPTESTVFFLGLIGCFATLIMTMSTIFIKRGENNNLNEGID